MNATTADIKYKATGLDWMPAVPEHWEVLRIKNLFQEIESRSETKDLKQNTFDFFRKRAFKSQRIEEDSLTDSNEHLTEKPAINRE